MTHNACGRTANEFGSMLSVLSRDVGLTLLLPINKRPAVEARIRLSLPPADTHPRRMLKLGSGTCATPPLTGRGTAVAGGSCQTNGTRYARTSVGSSEVHPAPHVPAMPQKNVKLTWRARTTLLTSAKKLAIPSHSALCACTLNAKVGDHAASVIVRAAECNGAILDFHQIRPFESGVCGLATGVHRRCNTIPFTTMMGRQALCKLSSSA